MGRDSSNNIEWSMRLVYSDVLKIGPKASTFSINNYIISYFDKGVKLLELSFRRFG